jgi:ATP-dependent exoDNAse (exonuclease V) beta subunit
MNLPALEKDSEIHLPQFKILKASAGSGKTYNLTTRYVQFILSEKIPENNPRNILAITFSNNAAKEMKERIIKLFKELYFEELEAIDHFSKIITIDKNNLSQKAGHMLEVILSNYSDFQVKTIDSFMTTVFKASAIDFGYNPEFDILIDIKNTMKYSFDRFLRNVREGSPETKLFLDAIKIILEQKSKESAYPWDPTVPLIDMIIKIYGKLASSGKELLIEDFSEDINLIKNKLSLLLKDIEYLLKNSRLEPNNNSIFYKLVGFLKDNRLQDIIGKGIKYPPVKKPSGKGELLKEYTEIYNIWSEVIKYIKQYTTFYVYSYYFPFLKIYSEFCKTLEIIKKQQGIIFIDDINKYLAEYLNQEIVPDIYFRLGETIFHYLIDEFQDTSPIQWNNLKPLLENSLSQNGSLFIVGDTKQAIYGFRNADYRIMKEAESKNPFPSAEHSVIELDTNYRSLKRILEFNEEVFKHNLLNSEDHKLAGEKSGLISYIQKPLKNKKSEGYAEVVLFEKNEENPPEKLRIQDLIKDLNIRNFKYKDIAILTMRNEDAVRITSWLNEKNIPFISHSSLDIRRRKVTGEIISLLNFLDSPTDNLSFSSFLLGDIFSIILQKDSHQIIKEDLISFIFNNSENAILYKAFQKNYEEIWRSYFADLFKFTGYLPLYDLTSEIFCKFRVFEIMENEEAVFIKILETIRDMEGEGKNSIKDFLEFANNAEDVESKWDVNIPVDIDAVHVMTIHKSKGLGFPVCIVLLYEIKNRGFEFITHENDKNISLLKITDKIKLTNPDLHTQYYNEVINELVNRLNSLYVGFTRAEEELYVIGVYQHSKEKFPINLLPSDKYMSTEKPVRDIVKDSTTHSLVNIQHYYNPYFYQIRSDTLINMAEKRRGDFIHKVFSYIEYIYDEFEDKIDKIIDIVIKETGDNFPQDKIKKVILNFLNSNNMIDFFKYKNERIILLEQEFSDNEGRLFRMDRVVIDRDKITVIDFKTGTDREEDKYSSQLNTYMKILKEIYPDKKIHGIIAYVDLKEIVAFEYNSN